MSIENPYIKQLREELARLNPHLVLLFGSHAHGSPQKDSDIDLLIVTNDDYVPKNFSEKTELYLKVNKHIRHITKKVPVDLIVYTRPMFKRFIELQSSFSKEILKNGVILYERNHQGMA